MKLIILLGLSMLVGCAGFNNVTSKQGVIDKFTVDYDNFKKIAWLNAPMMQASTFIEAAKKDHSDWQVDLYFLRAFVDKKTNTEFIQIYVSNASSDWLFFESAVDSDGNEMKFVKISRETSQNTKYGVGTVEDFAIGVTLDSLKAHIDNGISIRIYGKKGNRTLNIPGYYIDGFVEKYEAYNLNDWMKGQDF